MEWLSIIGTDQKINKDIDTGDTTVLLRVWLPDSSWGLQRLSKLPKVTQLVNEYQNDSYSQIKER